MLLCPVDLIFTVLAVFFEPSPQLQYFLDVLQLSLNLFLCISSLIVKKDSFHGFSVLEEVFATVSSGRT